MSTRDEFPKAVLDALAKRVGYRCSNPGCRQLTAGPSDEGPAKSVNVGFGAHITAAAEGGPRYDSALTTEQRAGADNGIWVCGKCNKLIDSDRVRYSEAFLRNWKGRAEAAAREELEGITDGTEKRPVADLMLRRRNVNITGERHDYKLEVTVHNVGGKILREYHVDVELPTMVLMTKIGMVPDRSDRQSSLFRGVSRGDGDAIYPEDRKVVLAIPYFIDDDIYQKRGDLLERTVRATLYEGGSRQVVVEVPFKDLQSF